MYTFKKLVIQELPVKYLEATFEPRYWDDAIVNGEVDDNGDLIPCRLPCSDNIQFIIDLKTGVIVNWESGVTASIHYKVCDAGKYRLLDLDKNEVHDFGERYVPTIMYPSGEGSGDYIIMHIDTKGKIEDWYVPSEFLREDND